MPAAASRNSCARKSIIFVDCITDLTRQAMVYAKQQPEAFSERTGKPDVRGAYGLLGREVIQALKHLQHAPGKTVIFVGVLEKVTDEFNVTTWQPQMEGSKAGRELPGIVDQVISMHLFSRDAEGGYVLDEKATERRLVCRAGNPFGLPAKDRSGRLDVTEPPDLGALLAKINTPALAARRSRPHRRLNHFHQQGDSHVRPQRCPAADAADRRTDPRRHLRQGADDHPPGRGERLDADGRRACSRPRSRATPRCSTASSRSSRARIARRKFWQNFTVAGGKLDDKGQSKGWNISKSAFRAMVDSALGLDPKDESPAAKQKRVIQGLKQLDGIVFAARIMVEPASNPQYKDANKLANVVLPGEPQYAAIMRGENVQPDPVNAKPRKAPDAPAAQAPAWGSSAAAGQPQAACPGPAQTAPPSRPQRLPRPPARRGSTAERRARMTDDEWQAHVRAKRRRRSANGSKEEEGSTSPSAL